VTPAANTVDRGSAAFAEVCLRCHDGPNPPLPDLSASALDAAHATNALRTIVNDEMPPATSSVRSTLSPTRRADIVMWLCRRTGRDDRTCADLATDVTARPRLRQPSTLLVELARGGLRSASEAHKELLQEFETTESIDLPVPPDARAIAAILLASMDACAITAASTPTTNPADPTRGTAREPPGSAPAAVDAATARACLDKLLSSLTTGPQQADHTSPSRATEPSAHH
jgi:hypothetical protein